MFVLQSTKLTGCWSCSCCSQAVLSEEELVGIDHVSATAAEVSSSMMRIKLELEEKKRTVNMLQAALVWKPTMHDMFSPPASLHTYIFGYFFFSGGFFVLFSFFFLPLQAQQRELTARHVKETEKELSRNFQLQKEQYEATIQRHLTFIDQVSAKL